ncbi:alpha/beta hydrolase [Saccharospirillum mangrovi]|uniref:alpha/beta hydrolase n=1 Tax=Saccharospirillum mangrovi TaxID=2161747 RepID=UPI001E5772B6|nr:alpha/beta hydrolase [Saccharospirillum mangrovi]
MTLSIKTMGELSIYCDGQAVDMPPSRRTRALLAYLALTARPHRRDRLCEVFWKLPDDPRSTLRWSLSKVRQMVNSPNKERLMADRERVSLLTNDIKIDIRDIELKANDPFTPIHELETLSKTLQETFLESIDLPGQELFQQWLIAQRREASQLRAKVMYRLSSHPDLSQADRLKWARTWEETEPFNPAAATRLITLLETLNQVQELSVLSVEFIKRFRSAGIAWSPKDRIDESADPGEYTPTLPSSKNLQSRQRIQFCTTTDKVRIAYASVGNGDPIVKAANWLNHLEYDWDSPIWSPLFRDLAVDHRFIRYDERGTGLSDWAIDDLSFEALITDLEAVVDTSGADQFTLLGISQGAAVSIAYAVRHPEKVRHLVLFGGYAIGPGLAPDPNLRREREALITLTKSGWSRENPAYRQIFSSTFMPGASVSETAWFNDLQRASTSPHNAAQLLTVFDHIDVQDLLRQVRVPTLVIHSRGDQRISVKNGLDLAAHIPNAEFLSLNSDNHALLGREPAAQIFIQSVREFIANH